MRCYHFCNFYLAGIHAGIQSAHAQHELAVRYLGNHSVPSEERLTADKWLQHLDRLDSGAEQYLNWAQHHKTMILLNAGMMGDLLQIEEFLDCYDTNRYAYASFREDSYALNFALTNICIILPYQMYELNHHIMEFDKEPWPGYYEFKHDGNDRKLVRLEGGVVELRAGTDVLYVYNEFDLELIRRMSRLRLM